LGYKSISGNIKRVFDKLLNKNLIQYTILKIGISNGSDGIKKKENLKAV
jgi:hypothetical protein